MLNNLYNSLLTLLALCTSLAYGQLDCPYTVDSAPLRPGIRTDLYRGQQAFSVDLLNAIQEDTPNENIFFSPYSTYHALLLAYFGATGETEQELAKALRLGWATAGKTDVQRGYRVEKQSREVRARKMPELQFSSADKIYFDKKIKISDCLSSSFMDELESLDFQNHAEEARLGINAWIANLTHNQIPNMLSPLDISAQTQMVLANAAYFKGQWTHKFQLEETRKDIFYTSVSNFSFVDMMHTRGTFNFHIDEKLGAYVLQMPYLTKNISLEETNQFDDEDINADISMIIILPPAVNNGIENVLKQLNPDTLENALNESMPRDIEVSMPKFEFEQEISLVPILQKIGIKRIFEHEAEFRHFSEAEGIVFGDAKHVAKIKVDEEGSTAAAATVLFSFRSARPVEPTKFECNHPFLFLIYDQTAKAVLFTGIYRTP